MNSEKPFEKKPALRGIELGGVKIVSITDCTSIHYGRWKAPKRRRV